jgi:Tfp pilus assembly protein PilF
VVKLLERIRSWCIDTTNDIAHFVRDNRGVSAAILSGIVLAIMIYGTFVSVLLPKQRMEKLRVAYGAGDFQASIEIAEKIVDADPRNIDAALALASAILQQGIIDGNLRDVIERARDVLRGTEPFATSALHKSEVSRQLGYTYVLTREMSRAADYLHKAIQFDATNPMAYAHMCYYYDIVNDLTRAMENCNKALELDPTNALALVGSTKNMIAAGNIRLARLQAESAVVAATDRVIRAKAYVASAHVQIMTQNLDGARENVQKALTENPKEFDALVLSAELSMRALALLAIQGEDTHASPEWVSMLRNANAAIRVDSSNYYPYLLFMRAYEIDGNLEAAARHRAIATRLITDDEWMTETEREEVLSRLNAADSIQLDSIRLLPAGTQIPADADRVIIKQ